MKPSVKLRLHDINCNYPNRVLRWNMKHDTVLMLADTSERAKAALKRMFTQSDEDGCYEYDLGEDNYTKKEIAKLTDIIEVYKKHGEEEAVKEKQRVLAEYEYNLRKEEKQSEYYKKAKTGDIEAIYNLLSYRKDYEYEGWEWIIIDDPLEKI